MRVSQAQIRRIAELAELHVDDAAAAELEGQINRILDHVAQIGELPHEGGVDDARAVRLRRDEPSADALQTPPAAFAPAFRDGLFTVPKLGDLDRGEDAP
jgi:aspartyl/glutamyl-tRNA(Asn/Gln) amidotransferase C subunit